MHTRDSKIFSQPVEAIIRRRFSCRTYIERPIEADIQEKIVDHLATIGAGPFGTRARFGLAAATELDRKALEGLGTYGFIRGATGFIIGAIQRQENQLEDFGYLLEKVLLFTTDLDLGTCWLGGSFTKTSFARKILARTNELVPAVVSVGYIAKKPRRIESFYKSGKGTDRRLPWNHLFFDGVFGMPLDKETAGKYQTPLEMVRLAPSASNRQPWRIIRIDNTYHFYLQRTPGYRKRTLVKLFTVADLQRIDMGIAMSHFELMARELNLGGYWEVNNPQVVIPNDEIEYTISWAAG